MRVLLKLHEPYTWKGLKRNRVYENNSGFIETNKMCNIYEIMYFEDFIPISLAGDLNVTHYKYFEGRKFIRVQSPYPRIEYYFEEYV